METNWTDAIRTTPLPETGTLTERALAQAPPPTQARRPIRPAVYGSLALAATLPVAFLLLSKPDGGTPQKIMPLKTAQKPSQAQHSNFELQLSFQEAPDALMRGLSTPLTPLVSKVTLPDASFTVASVKTETDGALVLMPKPSQHSMDEILKKPELHDYTQIKLMPAVVAALKAKGITEFIGKSIQASGKSESSVYLAFPAFVVTTVTVEKAEDVQIELKPLQAQLFLQRLRAAKDHQVRYELLISPEFNETLLAAAQRGDEATVIELVQWSWFGGPGEAAKGGNGVTWAAYCPTLEPVKALLERGVPAGVADSSGNTGLHRTYRPEIAALLLKHKAPTETKNTDGETPLLAQTRQADRWLGRLGVVQALLDAGANPNATDNQGRTPLMWAAKSGLPDLVSALLAKGADPKRKDKDGKTAHNYITAWPWGTAPGFLTVEAGEKLKHDSEADLARVEKLLIGR